MTFRCWRTSVQFEIQCTVGTNAETMSAGVGALEAGSNRFKSKVVAPRNPKLLRGEQQELKVLFIFFWSSFCSISRRQYDTDDDKDVDANYPCNVSFFLIRWHLLSTCMKCLWTPKRNCRASTPWRSQKRLNFWTCPRPHIRRFIWFTSYKEKNSTYAIRSSMFECVLLIFLNNFSLRQHVKINEFHIF